MLFYINSFLLGGDTVAIQIGPISLRLVVITILIGLSLHIIQYKSLLLYSKQMQIYTLFIGAIILSIPQSIDIARSIAYLFWMVFLATIQTSYFNFEYARRGPINFENALLKLYRFCTIALFVEFSIKFFIGDGSRPHLFFYEPAHTAIFMIPYLVIAVINASSNSNSKDVLLSLSGMLILFSATALFSVIGTLFLVAIFVPKSRAVIFSAIVILMAIAITFILATGANEYINLMIGFLASADDFSSALELIFHRSGTRIIRFYYGIDAFFSAPWFGIGAGAANAYTSIHDIPSEAIQYYDPEWDDVFANPFVNPFIEASATMGILGALALVFLAIRLLVTSRVQGFQQKMAISAAAMFLGIFLESTFLRHYIWLMVSLAFIPCKKRNIHSNK